MPITILNDQIIFSYANSRTEYNSRQQNPENLTRNSFNKNQYTKTNFLKLTIPTTEHKTTGNTLTYREYEKHGIMLNKHQPDKFAEASSIVLHFV